MTTAADGPPDLLPAPDAATSGSVGAGAGLAEFANPGGTLGERLGIEIVEATPARVVGTMPVEGNTQPYGLLHGGASCALAETLGSVGAMLHGLEIGRTFAVGVDINATHHKAARSGLVTGVATAVHRGRTLATYEVVITDVDGDRVCSARITCLLRGA